MRVSSEKREERRVTRRRGRSSENNLIRTAIIPTAAADGPCLAGITMLHGHRYVVHYRRQVSSFIDSLLHVILLSFIIVLHSRLPHLLPSYLLTFSLSLSLAPSDKVCQIRTHAHPRRGARSHALTNTHTRTCTHTHTHARTRTPVSYTHLRAHETG